MQLIRGARADALLADDAFVRDWGELCARCPWATAYQGAPYVRTWYASYRERYEPLLVVSRDDGGRLNGLFTLALSPQENRIGAAGLWQAEYHTWVSEEALGDAFAVAALRALRNEFPSMSMHLQYLAPGTPLAWLGNGSEADAALARRCVLRPHRRPILQFGDGEQVRASFKKRSNKGRLRRLARHGPVEFRHVTSAEEVDRAFDTIARIYDARRLAVNGLAPFQVDRHKRSFHLALMRQPGLMHATVLTVGERVVSAQLNVLDRGRQARLNFIAYDPLLSDYSPGKFHILMLARMLFESGYLELDLTPGEDAYKQRFANAWDQVHTLTVLPGATARARTVVFHRATDLAKRTLTRMEVRPAQAEATWRQFWDTRDRIQKLRLVRHAAWGVVRRGARRVAGRRTCDLYRCDSAAAKSFAADVPVRRDSLEDLLAYPERSLEAGTRQSFLSGAFQRIERGMHAYTSVGRGGRLSHIAWVAERASSTDEQLHPAVACADADSGSDNGGGTSGANVGAQEIDLTEPLTPSACHLQSGSALISSLIVVDEHATADENEAFVRSLLRAVGGVEDVGRVFIAVPRSDVALHRAVEKMGLTIDRTVVERRTFGVSRRHVVKPNAAVAAPAAPGDHHPDAQATRPVDSDHQLQRIGQKCGRSRQPASAGAHET